MVTSLDKYTHARTPSVLRTPTRNYRPPEPQSTERREHDTNREGHMLSCKDKVHLIASNAAWKSGWVMGTWEKRASWDDEPFACSGADHIHRSSSKPRWVRSIWPCSSQTSGLSSELAKGAARRSGTGFSVQRSRPAEITLSPPDSYKKRNGPRRNPSEGRADRPILNLESVIHRRAASPAVVEPIPDMDRVPQRSSPNLIRNKSSV